MVTRLIASIRQRLVAAAQMQQFSVKSQNGLRIRILRLNIDDRIVVRDRQPRLRAY